MSRLAVFDIDGTVCDTIAVDDACYLQAVAAVLGLDARTLDWSAAPDMTDTAIMSWLCSAHCSRSVEADEEEAAMARFVDLLNEQCQSAPESFAAISGAPAALSALPAAGWDVAFATGGWRPSALLKLGRIGIDPDGYVIATSSDAPTRAEIVALAIARSQRRHGHSYERIVSIGDGVWDVRTAAELELPFVGVGSGEVAKRLRAAGAEHVLPNFIDLSALYDVLDRASVPALRKA